MTDDTAPFDAGALARWIRTRLDVDDVTVRPAGRPSGGFSAETHFVDAEITTAGVTEARRFVLRMETPEPAVYPPQSLLDLPEIEIQFRVMSALARSTDLPLADLIGYSTDTDVCGAPFFVMGHVAGEVPGESPPYTTDGFFVSAQPGQRTSMISSGLARLADLHAVDRSTLDLDWLVPGDVTPGSRHLARLWRTFGEQELGDRRHSLLERAWDIVDAELPDDGRLVVCWGDARPGNIIWRDFAPVCLTDFEAACVGPPEFDLAWWLMFDRTMHEGAGVTRAPGDPDREEQRRLYFAHAGREPVDTEVHELFAAARYCVIVVRVMNRLDQRGLLPADSTVWLDNPASSCLATMLAERE